MTNEETRRYHRHMGLVEQRVANLWKRWALDNPRPEGLGMGGGLHTRKRMDFGEAIRSYRAYERLAAGGSHEPETREWMRELRKKTGIGWIDAETREERMERLREEAAPAMAAMHAYGLLEAC